MLGLTFRENEAGDAAFPCRGRGMGRGSPGSLPLWDAQVTCMGTHLQNSKLRSKLANLPALLKFQWKELTEGRANSVVVVASFSSKWSVLNEALQGSAPCHHCIF